MRMPGDYPHLKNQVRPGIEVLFCTAILSDFDCPEALKFLTEGLMGNHQAYALCIHHDTTPILVFYTNCGIIGAEEWPVGHSMTTKQPGGSDLYDS